MLTSHATQTASTASTGSLALTRVNQQPLIVGPDNLITKTFAIKSRLQMKLLRCRLTALMKGESALLA